MITYYVPGIVWEAEDTVVSGVEKALSTLVEVL